MVSSLSLWERVGVRAMKGCIGNTKSLTAEIAENAECSMRPAFCAGRIEHLLFFSGLLLCALRDLCG
jgi:hypothetical protein